ncbi:MAG TPA: M2 family metallopeptidase, partial [Allosphingosinicella sp.]
MKAAVSAFALAISLAACAAATGDTETATASDAPAAPAAAPAAEAAPTPAEAAAFVQRAEKELAELSVVAARADWVNQTYITDDTEALAAHFGTLDTEMRVRLANEAARFATVQGLDYDTQRKLNLLRASLTLAAPTTPGAAAELNTIKTRLQGIYGKGRGSLGGKELTGNDIEERMGTVRNPAQLQEMWTSWNNNVGRPMRQDYTRQVEIANEGAKALGFADTGAMWRSRYDMDPDAFAAMTDRLWNEVKPLYDQLHCYTRGKLNQKYGDSVQPDRGPIRSDLLGNLWAQEWGGIYDVVAPKGAGDVGYDLTDLLVRKKYTPEKIVRTGESFFTSLGFAPLP